jgi:tetrapyrrole methylase family protein/MazG family protein
MADTDGGGGAAREAARAFREFYETVARLRAPDGCPWDREQTPASLRGSLIEETYECVEAIDEGDAAHIREELGDVFLVAAMLACMHEQSGAFSAAAVLDGVREKIVRRHPHVFGDVRVRDSAGALANWARIKVEQEGRNPKDSALDSVSRGLPPLDRAWKLQKRAAKAGFDWPGAGGGGAAAKVREELNEVEAALRERENTGKGGVANVVGASPPRPPRRCAATPATPPASVPADGGAEAGAARGQPDAVEAELGDLLFSAVNLCRRLGVEPSAALQRANAKFTRRFKHVEKRMKETRAEMNAGNLALMDGFWEEAKGQE